MATTQRLMAHLKREKERQERSLKPIDWGEVSGATYKEPEYRIHPLMGHQVRSRHIYTREPPKREIATGHAHQRPTLTPKELDPAYRDIQETEFEAGDLINVKQYPVILQSPDEYPKPDFTGIESVRLRHAVEILEFTIGYDRKSNKFVLYSPLVLNDRWDRASQALWMRSIGMTPKNISVVLNIKYDTIKNWMRVFKGKPLVRATAYDWGTGFTDRGEFRYASKTSSLDAPKHEYDKEMGVNINPQTGLIEDDRGKHTD